ncbi:uncharacterized protein LACBIDRAFT_298255 [Laccaria bicolor S238N-H82]|uniref:Predicted protein n=1 Tax=Laccaria bicolor (strain S238N-H82 / ATCC MYA-4686) TaxID=486041 RepID=B0DCK6_LACBS|nr:uncharacterized protein LACBIDRAFT_298255 [Laccaria bicolor S238N-H82]EDR07913.1 predicted protein [Laccaria bicolor S238N-H82]|eukprot:XP_001881702.1 predicted protein [Laccaria bicolor S238N-H82]
MAVSTDEIWPRVMPNGAHLNRQTPQTEGPYGLCKRVEILHLRSISSRQECVDSFRSGLKNGCVVN